MRDPNQVARAILRERRFRGSGIPRPFHHLLVWLGRPLHRTSHWAARPFSRPYHWLAGVLPGGSWGVDVLIAIFVLIVAAVVVTRIAGSRALASASDSFDLRDGSAVDPAELERQADAADRAGNAEEAVRLRFRAGMLRLGRARILPARDSVTTGEARRTLRLPEFDEIARAHDEIVFAGRPAIERDAVEARDGWPRVLGEARSRR